jgi:CheY-like chemotaxis protein
MAARLRPDFVLLDIGLPGMDGYQLARSLKHHVSCEEMVIIAVTGYGQPEDRQRSCEAGIDHHLVKPVDYDVLLGLLAQCEAGSVERAARGQTLDRSADDRSVAEPGQDRDGSAPGRTGPHTFLGAPPPLLSQRSWKGCRSVDRPVPSGLPGDRWYR